MKKTDEPNVDGITERDFLAWRHDPVTKVFMKYLRDYGGAVKARVVAQWETGALQLMTEQEARGRYLVTKEIAELQFSSIIGLYAVDEPEEEQQS